MAKKKVNRGGLIPYTVKDGEIYMMFMKPSRPKFGGDQFQIAKGKQEPNEDIAQTAIREAKEELGLFVGNIVNVDNLGVWLGRMTVFIAEIKDPAMFGDPTTPDEVGEVKWLSPEEFNNVGRGLHKPIVKAAARKIQKYISIQQKKLDEIQIIQNEIEKGFSWDQVDTSSGQKMTLSSQPYEVWKYPTMRYPDQVVFALRDPSLPPEKSAAVLVGTFYKGYFQVQRAWTRKDLRRQGLMTQLYVTLNGRLQIPLASDVRQSNNMKKLWSALPLKQLVQDTKTGEKFNRDEISDNDLYSATSPHKYRLIIEKDTSEAGRIISHITSFDSDTNTNSSILYEYDIYTHPDTKGRYI